MGYETAKGRYALTQAVSLAKGQVSSATGALAGSVYELADAGVLRLDLNVTAAGTTLTVTVETSKDGSTNWTSVGAFTAMTAVGSQRKVFAGCDRFVRLNVTAITGSFTYDCTGEGV